MNVIRKAVSALGGIFLAALLIAALAPKAAHGIAAALVQITNTSANPVPNLDVDDPGKAPRVVLNCEASAGSNNCTFLDPSGVHFFVPAGQRLVIDEIDGQWATPTGQIVTSVFVRFAEAGASPAHFLPVTPQGGFTGLTFFSFNQAVRWVADPGSDFELQFQASDPTFSTNCFINLSGHLIRFP